MNAALQSITRSDSVALSIRAARNREPDRRPLTLSSIIPNYNHGHLLERCVGALLNQSRRPDEIIIVDDASTDDSREVLEKGS